MIREVGAEEEGRARQVFGLGREGIILGEKL
jgi:hypothetical protein